MKVEGWEEEEELGEGDDGDAAAAAATLKKLAAAAAAAALGAECGGERTRSIRRRSWARLPRTSRMRALPMKRRD